MRFWKLITHLLLTVLLALGASGTVNAKVASGDQNLLWAGHQADGVFNWLTHQGKSARSTRGPPGSPVATKSGSTTLYRAVSKAELDDIAANGLRTTPGGYETGKLFATSLDDAAKFGKNNFKLDGISNHLIKVDVPNSVMKGATNFMADGMKAVSIPANQLK
ncbi:MAG: hypothetical protein GY703_17265 [Gammaproteobacteria bacterium]|nr:hypothetical protein [Gammaproteobacteria bacterium]